MVDYSFYCIIYFISTAGVVVVEFSSQEEQDSAMSKSKNFLGPKRVYLHKTQVVESSATVQTPSRLI